MKLETVGKTVGELAVWRIINFPNQPMLFPVKTVDEAVRMIDALAQIDLQNDGISCNAFGLMEWDGAEWLEWQNEDGDTIDEYAELIEVGDV